MKRAPIRIEATVSAPSTKVWSAWTQPEHITQWNFASPDWHCPKASNDLKVGGKFTSRMEAKDGSFGFDFEGIYDEVVDQKKIVYSMADGRKVTTTFEPQGNNTKVVTVFDQESENPEELQRNGWQAILNNFKNHAEKN
jgi:uncharacterized protein YndB with AHSA1/START domain